MAIKKKAPQKQPPRVHIGLWIVLAVTLAAFLPSTKNDFVNWDDVVYIMNNDMIRAFTGENISRMFSSFFMGNYHPLTLLSFAADWSLFELKAAGYHWHNLLLHLANAALVYFVAWQLFARRELPAFIVAALFAIHPMHVESVAWVSERKDLLYTFWFLAAMLAYIRYNQTGRSAWLMLTLAAFVLSLLAKAQAVTLPVVLVLLDLLMARKNGLKMWLEKVPFFILALVAGYIAILAQRADGSVNSEGLTIVQSIFYAHYSIWVYLYKTILPIGLTCLYEYPFNASGGVPWYVWAAPAVWLPLAAAVILARKKMPVAAFGIVFFLAVIFPVLQFLPVGRAIVAERYTYIPYIGLFMALAALFLAFRERLKQVSHRRILEWSGVAVLLLFSLITFDRTKVWANSVTLWTDVMEKNPGCMSAYINRSYMYIQYKQYDQTIRDCMEGLKLDSTQYKLNLNLGTAYRHLGKPRDAIAQFSIAIRKKPDYAAAYLDRGILYTDVLNQYDSGIADFREYLRTRSEDPNGHFNLGVALYKSRDFDGSLAALQRTLELKPGYAGAYYIRALVFAARRDYKAAYENGAKALNLGFDVKANTLEEWRQAAGIIIH